MSSRARQHSRVVVVTGATAGVGRAIAKRFAQAGDRVGLIARDVEALDAMRKEFEARGTEVAVAAADVADAEAVAAAGQYLEDQLGAVDIWVNDAMETVFSRFTDITPQEFRRVTEVCYLGFVYGTMTALKSMRPRGRGCIVQIGSALAYRGIPLQSAYCGAKHAIRGFTDSVRTELISGGSGIRITMIDLPAVNTPQFDWARVHMSRTPRPMGRPIEPEVVADAVFRAVRGTWREYWLGLPTIQLIIGNTVLPGLLDRYLAKNAIGGQLTKEAVPPERRDNLDQPITPLHRTRGSFSAEASSRAPMVPAELARVGVVATGALLFFVIGAAWGGLRRGRSRLN
jgi:NAD(P)-dependent dehydrogenase (short-subunit alcohol dehydrogenase family)